MLVKVTLNRLERSNIFAQSAHNCIELEYVTIKPFIGSSKVIRLIFRLGFSAC